MVVALAEDGKDAEDDKRRFNVVMQLANKVDLDTIVDFCKGNKQTEAAKEMMVSWAQTCALLTLAHCPPSHERAIPTRSDQQVHQCRSPRQEVLWRR